MRILTRLWSEDSSTPVSLESRNQPKKGKTKARPTKQTTTRKGQKQHEPKKQGGRGQVLKNLTRLWPGSSSTLTGEKWIENHPTLEKLMYDNTAEAAHKAVREQ